MEHVSLTPSQSAVLFVLMSLARDVPNPELRRCAPELTKKSRETLNDQGLIESVLTRFDARDSQMTPWYSDWAGGTEGSDLRTAKDYNLTWVF